MKLTKRQLREIIREEMKSTLSEAGFFKYGKFTNGDASNFYYNFDSKGKLPKEVREDFWNWMADHLGHLGLEDYPKPLSRSGVNDLNALIKKHAEILKKTKVMTLI